MISFDRILSNWHTIMSYAMESFLLKVGREILLCNADLIKWKGTNTNQCNTIKVEEVIALHKHGISCPTDLNHGEHV